MGLNFSGGWGFPEDDYPPDNGGGRPDDPTEVFGDSSSLRGGSSDRYTGQFGNEYGNRPPSGDPDYPPHHRKHGKRLLRVGAVVVGGAFLSAGVGYAYQHYDNSDHADAPASATQSPTLDSSPSELPPRASETPTPSASNTNEPSPTPSPTPTASSPSPSETSSVVPSTPASTSIPTELVPPTARPSGSKSWIGATMKKDGKVVPAVICNPASKSEVVQFVDPRDVGSTPGRPVPLRALQNELGHTARKGFNFRLSMDPVTAEQLWLRVQLDLNDGRRIANSFNEKPFWGPSGCYSVGNTETILSSASPSPSPSQKHGIPPTTTLPSTAPTTKDDQPDHASQSPKPSKLTSSSPRNWPGGAKTPISR